MIKPLIHLNGSGKTLLEKNWMTVYTQTRNLEDALCDAHPHGRDYYPLGADAYRQAAEEHMELRKALDIIRQYTNDMLEHLAETE
jgi:hypothetical protein